MLNINNTLLLVIDIQGKLASMMHDKIAVYENVKRLIKGARVLEMPIIWTEQYPEGIGATIPEIAKTLDGFKPIPKMTFSCCRNDEFLNALKATNRKQILVTGIETHICVYQTTLELLDAGYEVEVVADAVSSRTPQNKEIGLQKMKTAGAGITGTETALYELLKVAKGPEFKQILKIVK
jgi:nicotinamidase-related amidase